MERQLKLHGDAVMRMLTMQYRMNDVIMTWSSDQLYDGRLTAHHSVSKHLLCDIAGVEKNENTSTAMLLIDTSGCYVSELHLPDEVSKGNEGEADLVSYHVEQLVKSGLKAQDIAVISPYNLQVDFLRLRLSHKYPSLEIKSVDGFQGREKEAVIISMVRSNDKGEVGFLADKRRINVAITRARRHLAVVCDTETVNHDSFLKTLIEYMMEHGEVRSAQQYINDSAFESSIDRPEYVERQFEDSAEWTAQKKMHNKKSADKKVEGKPLKKSKSEYIKRSDKTTAQHVESNKEESDLKIISEEDEKIALQTTIEEFLQNGDVQEYSFPSTLSSRARFLVHELSEAFGLLHVSEGDGKNRYISIKKPSKEHLKTSGEDTKSNLSTEKAPDNDNVILDGTKKKKTASIKQCSKPNNLQPSKENSKIEHDASKEFATCETCGKEIPSDNLKLHGFRCTPSVILNQQQPGSNEATKPKKKKKSAKNKNCNDFKKGIKNVDDDDFDSLIQAAIEQNTVCNFPKCKAYTTTVGQTCMFCKKRFCLSHHIPEIHGCGADAKAHARAVINKEGVLYRGSGVPDKSMDPNKKAFLHRKLDRKLNEMNDQRKIKKKDKK